jgi:hypothetical protein
MADLTLPLIGLTTLVGYFFNKDGRNVRQENFERTQITPEDKPNGANIYSSNMVNEANQDILEKSLQNYKDAETPSKTGYIPPLFNTYSSIGQDVNKIQVGLSGAELSEINKVNRLNNVKEDNSINDISKMPMFNSFQNLSSDISQTFVEVSNKNTSNVNVLTGLPFDKDHSNMVPFFGSSTKQNAEQFSNVSLLDKYTGSTDTFQHKKEVSSFYDNKQENIYGTPVFATQIETDRYVPSLYKQNEKISEPERISAPKGGTIDNNIRPVFKSIDELRTVDKRQETYKGRTLAGQMGEVRGIQPSVEKRRPDTFYEKGFDHLFRGPGQYVAPTIKEDFSKNLKSSARQEYNLEYYGNLNNNQHNKTIQRLSNNVDNSNELQSALFQEPKRQNFENDHVRNLSGDVIQQDTFDFGRSSMKQYQSERSTTEDKTHNLNVNQKNTGLTVRPQDSIKTTLKQTTLNKDKSGNIKTTFDVGRNSAYTSGIVDIDAKTTQKQTLIDNKYMGQMQKSDGMGYLVNKYDAKVTGKEIITNNSDYISTGAALVKNPQIYKREISIRDDKQDLLLGQRPSGPQTFQTASGKVSFADIKVSDNMLIKEESDTRDKFQSLNFQNIPSKEILGKYIRKNESREEKNNRFDINMIEQQLSNNPYVINSAKKI